MKITTMLLKQLLILLFLNTFTISQAVAVTDIKNSNKAQVKQDQHKSHSKNIAETQKYHGVFYGFLPCKDCDGTKATLSLKNRNNYLLVTQPAKASAREYFEKGKYIWDEESKTVTLTSRKNSVKKYYKISDEEKLTQVSSKGSPLTTSQKNTSYVLHKNERVNQGTSIHMH